MAVLYGKKIIPNRKTKENEEAASFVSTPSYTKAYGFPALQSKNPPLYRAEQDTPTLYRGGISTVLPSVKYRDNKSSAQPEKGAEETASALPSGKDAQTETKGDGLSAEAGKTLTFEEFLAADPSLSQTSSEEQSRAYQGYLNERAVQSILDKRLYAYQNADVARERAILDAKAAAQKQSASYGSQAARLESMGLQGSGFAQHISDAAYAQERAEIAVANAERNAAYRAADATYSSELAAHDQKTADRETSYQNALAASRAEIGENIANGYTSVESAMIAAKNAGLSEESTKQLVSDSIAAGFYNGTFSAADIVRHKDRISRETYDKMMNDYNASIKDELDSLFYTTDETGAKTALERKTAIGERDALLASAFVSEETKQAISDKFKEIYGEVKESPAFEAKNITVADHLKIESGLSNPYKGNNFKIKDKYGRDYRVEIGKKATAEQTQTAKDSGIKNGDIFRVGEDFYLMKEGEVWSIQARHHAQDEKANEYTSLQSSSEPPKNTVSDYQHLAMGDTVNISRENGETISAKVVQVLRRNDTTYLKLIRQPNAFPGQIITFNGKTYLIVKYKAYEIKYQ